MRCNTKNKKEKKNKSKKNEKRIPRVRKIKKNTKSKEILERKNFLYPVRFSSGGGLQIKLSKDRFNHVCKRVHGKNVTLKGWLGFGA